jgi:hypothetical protein
MTICVTWIYFNQRRLDTLPQHDLNPSIDKDGLALNIDMDNNALDFRAMEVAENI